MKLEERHPKRYNHRLALYGLGGIGKTQLALEYAHMNKPYYAYIFWLEANTSEKVLQGFEALEKGVDTTLEQGREPARRFLNWLRGRENWLFVINNLNDVTLIQDLLPTSDCTGHTLITTRNGRCEEGIPAAGLEVLPMEVTLAARFILDQAGFTLDVTADSEESTSLKLSGLIAKELGQLPLALEQAASYVRVREGCNLSTYLETYRLNRQPLLEWTPGGNFLYSKTVATTWTEDLNRLSGETRKFLTLLSFLEPSETSLDFLVAGSSGLKEFAHVVRGDVPMTRCIAELRDVSLIQVWDGGGKFKMHPMVQAVVQDQLSDEERADSISTVIALGSAAFPNVTEERVEDSERFLMQAVACLRYGQDARFRLECVPLAQRLIKYCDSHITWEIPEWVLQLVRSCSESAQSDVPAPVTELPRDKNRPWKAALQFAWDSMINFRLLKSLLDAKLH
jgi:hypothetical protein